MPTPQRTELAAEPFDLRLAATAPIEIAFAAAGADAAKKLPTFSIVGYTGAVVFVETSYYPVILDMTGLRASGQVMPALKSHDPDRVVGQTTKVAIDSTARFEGQITGENADAVEVLQQSKNGFKWQASIGATVVRREFLEIGKRATVNGRDVVGPIVIAREAVIKEISFVALGADSNTSASVAASRASQKGDMSMSFDDWLRGNGFDPASLSDQQRTTLKASFDHAKTPPPAAPPAAQPPAAPPAETPQTQPTNFSATTPPPSDFNAFLAEQNRENERVDKIQNLSMNAIRERPLAIASIEEITKKAIEAKATPEQFELSIIRMRANQTQGSARGGTEFRANARVVEAAVCQSLRLNNVEKLFDERTLEQSHDRFKGRVSLQELLVMAARENGFTGYSAKSDLRSVLMHAFPNDQFRGSGGFSSFSVSGILSNVANKVLLNAFNAVESSWRRIAQITPVSDFKTRTSYSLTGDLTFQKVGPGGEIKHGTLDETTYTNKADTYARMLAITRTDIINDDLGAFARVPQKLGRGAALSLNDVFWTEFLGGVGTFWASGNSNVSTGGGSALSDAGLAAADSVFRTQTDPDGNVLGSIPRILLVPTQLRVTAAQLMQSDMVNTGGSSSTTRVPNANTWKGMFEPVDSSYLSNSSYTGYSSAGWWLLADPQDLATIDVAFLNGVETPTVESADADFEQLGIKIRGYYDFGVALQEYRASVRSAGS